MLVLTSCGTIRGRKADGALLPSLLCALRNKCPVSQYMSIDVDVDKFNINLSRVVWDCIAKMGRRG